MNVVRQGTIQLSENSPMVGVGWNPLVNLIQAILDPPSRSNSLDEGLDGASVHSDLGRGCFESPLSLDVISQLKVVAHVVSPTESVRSGYPRTGM